jgi:hypothetical protein
MPNRLQAFNLFDFRGGINLRPETFQLQENEMPELLNMEIDPRGGLNTRKGWVGFGPKITTSAWDPRLGYALTTSLGDRYWLVSNKESTNGVVYARTNSGSWVSLPNTATPASPHLNDYATWGDEVWVTCGRGQTWTWNGSTRTNLTLSGAANWQNDYAVPGAVDTAPAAEVIDQSHGYLFVAATFEDGVYHPNRIRWSHPNNPKRWAQSDYIDVDDGGSKITGLVSFSDRVLIFKPDSVWALFGYDADSWEMANVSRTIGCLNQQTVARNETAVFFMSWPQGIFAYTDRGITELSEPIRTVFQDRKMDADSIHNSWLGWVGRRLWCSLPFEEDAVPPTDAMSVFVFDPTLSDPGSWMMFRGAGYCVPGPYLERTDADQNTPLIAFNRKYAYLQQLEVNGDSATDTCVPGQPQTFDTRMRTKWIDAGAPTWMKSWRRPDFLLRGLTFDTFVKTQVFHDYDNFNAQRSFVIRFLPDNVPARYTDTGLVADGGFLWGDGTLYGGSEQTNSVERGGTMGRAGAVQVRCVGDPGVTWGLNGIVFKFVPRRFH